MNLLIVGAGSGSWTMRGMQLGAALGATVTSHPQTHDFEAADVVLLVKRAAQAFADRARRAGKPVVWDALDFWRQPGDNALTADQACALLARQRDALRADLTIGATAAMAAAAQGSYVPHHSWAGLAPTPARPAVASVAYQGNPLYLGRWQGWLQAACQRRGWRLDINPLDLAAADLVVSFRDGAWDGWMCRQWKSGVKVVNAIAAGRPLISQDSAARRELAPDGTVVEAPDELEGAFDAWTSASARAAVVERARGRAQEFTVTAVADGYRTLLEKLA